MKIFSWKVYFVLILAYELCAVIYLGIFNEIPFNFNTILNWFCIVGLWGVAYQRSILSRYIWVVAFWGSVLTLFNTWLLNPFILYSSEHDISVILATLAFALPSALLPLALFQYSSKNNMLWKTPNKSI